MDETNGRARVDVGFEDERRNLAAEIMRLSPPAPGCKERARRILECEFSLNELEVLAEALRDGFGAVVKPETQGVALQNIFAIARSQRVPADPQVDFTVGGPRTRLYAS